MVSKMISSLIRRARMACWNAGYSIRRYFRVRRAKKHPPIPIFCNNCIGGRISHDLGWPFVSPTVNLWMSVRDFVSLSVHFLIPRRLPSIKNVTSEFGTTYPVGMADNGEVIHFLHYPSFKSAMDAWNRRISRTFASTEPPVFVAVDNSNCSEADIRAFLRIHGKKKMIVYESDKAALLGDCGILCSGKKYPVGNVSFKTGWTGRWLYERFVPYRWILKPDS